jgi:hypothetical protein
MAVFAAQNVEIETCVEADGTGLRRLVLAADPDRRKTVETNIEKMDPDASWVVRKQGVLAEEYRLEQDARFTQGRAFSDLKIERQTGLGGPSLVRTTYVLSDRITRTAYKDTEKEQQAAPKTEFEYSVTMPGEIDMASTRPPGGKIDGETITWTLKADKETLDVTATSQQAEWMPFVLIIYVVLVLALFGLRWGLSWKRTRPRRI